jgi:RimJ/RimL family protein N-acetyltransferase
VKAVFTPRMVRRAWLRRVPCVSLIPPAPEVVESGDLVLAPFRHVDAARLAEAFADPEIARWNPGVADEAGVVAWIERRNDWHEGVHASWGVFSRTGDLVGSVSLHRIDADQLDAEIGYFVVPSARGRGNATRAVQAATRYAFDRLTLHRVHLFHAAANIASCRVAMSAGYRLEGELRRSFRYSDGDYHDEHLHAILADEVPG